MKYVLHIARKNASFDGETNESDFAIAAHFPEGFLVAEDESEVIGFVFAHFIDVPSSVVSKWGASKVGEISLLSINLHRFIFSSFTSSYHWHIAAGY